MYDTFLKAMKGFFGEPQLSISEFKDLTTDDKIELSTELNKIPGFDHPQYAPKAS